MKISLDSLDEEIQKQLKEFISVDVRQAINESFQETANEAAKMLKQGGPYTERSGKYTKDWDSQKRDRESAVDGVESYSAYNKKHYQLTHLLEFGHQSRNGGRVKAYSHISDVNERVGDLAVEKLEKRLRG